MIARAGVILALVSLSPVNVPGVIGVSFGTAQRYKDTSGKEMCAIVTPLADPPVFPRGAAEISYGVHLQARAVKQAAAQLVTPADQELRRLPCNIFMPVQGGFSQTQLGSTISRVDKKPLRPGKYTLRITVDGRSAEIPFEIAK